MINLSRIIGIKQGISLILGMLLFVGCASKGALITETPMTTKLADYKTMLLHVSSQVPGSSEEVIQLESMTVAKLREMGLFEKVIAGSASPDVPADLRLNVRIVELREVSSGKRVFLGALAGRARIAVDAELIDLQTGKTIGAFKAEGKSSGGTVFAGTTEQAIERVVEQIVEFVQKRL